MEWPARLPPEGGGGVSCNEYDSENYEGELPSY